MKILLSNDDGYDAIGIQTLKKVLLAAGHQVTLIAPDRNRSACSSSLTVRQSLRPIQIDENTWSIEEGTPADCIHLALLGMIDFEPNAIISGINDSANLGDDTLYSGTVAAALEARFIQGPKIAVSITEGDRFQQAAELTLNFLEQIISKSHLHQDILNINIPDLPRENIAGWRTTRLGKRLKSHPMTKDFDTQGRVIYHIGAVGESHHHRQGTDFEAIEQNFISISPIHIDMTNHSSIDPLSEWLDQSLLPPILNGRY